MNDDLENIAENGMIYVMSQMDGMGINVTKLRRWRRWL